MKLLKISKLAANDNPEYVTVETNQQAVQNGIVYETGMQSTEPHSTSIPAEENIAYETSMQSMNTEVNIAYRTGMQEHNPHAQEHNASVWVHLVSLASPRIVLTESISACML